LGTQWAHESRGYGVWDFRDRVRGWHRAWSISRRRRGWLEVARRDSRER